MSDDDRYFDSEDGEDSDSRTYVSRQSPGAGQSQHATQNLQAEKRAHHNALERKRRDHIKDSFSSLKDCVPTSSSEKVQTSRAQILKRAAEYILQMRRKNMDHQQDIEKLQKQNATLEGQKYLRVPLEGNSVTVRTLEKAKASGAFLEGADVQDSNYDELSGSETSDMDEPVQQRRPKKMKIGNHH